MKTLFKKTACLVLVMSLFCSTAFGQLQEKKKASGPRRQLAAIVFAGLGGAVLGLSTLSFYGRPQDYLVNIAIGFAVGVISGTIYVTFRTATTREYYEDFDNPNQPGVPPRGVNYLGTDADLYALNGSTIMEVHIPKVLFSPALFQDKPNLPPSYGAQLVYTF